MGLAARASVGSVIDAWLGGSGGSTGGRAVTVDRDGVAVGFGAGVVGSDVSQETVPRASMPVNRKMPRRFITPSFENGNSAFIMG